MDIFSIISLLGGVALFLFGMSLMGEGLKKIAGNRLELLLYKLTSTPLKGILLGTGVTAVIQSSSATSAMVVGFVNSGMMQLRQAIGIILGAILGTSVTGWVICLSALGSSGGLIQILSTSTLTGIIAIIGIILRMFSKKQTRHQLGDILLGFAVLMFGMSTMSAAVSPLKESAAFINLLTVFSNPILGILVGILFTSILQSASAAVGILQALAMTGAIDFSTALPLIMGIAIGAAVPVLLSALGANDNGKRTSLVYLLINIFGVAFCGIVFYAVNAVYPLPFMSLTMTTVSIALLNTVFRFITILVLAPLTGVLERITGKLVKVKSSSGSPVAISVHLEDRFLPYPPLAISHCREFAQDMARITQNGLNYAFDLLKNYNDEEYRRVDELENLSDKYEDSIGTYLMKITRYELTKEQNAEVSKFLHTLSDFERISDHTENIANVAKEINEKGISYSGEAQHELNVIQSAISEILAITVDSFVRDDIELAAKVEPLEEVIDSLCDEMKLHHVDRLQKGLCSLEQGFTFNDLLTNYERISDHCSNVALAIIELETDEFNTHEYLKNIEKMKQESFTRHFEEFQSKYSFDNP